MVCLAETPGVWPGQQCTLGFLGPPGSHSHQAALTAAQRLGFDSSQLALEPQPTLGLVLHLAETGALDWVVVPYENALQGSVQEVMEALGTGQRQLTIHAEFLQPVRHGLIQRRPGTPVRKVLSHPQALAQCRQTLYTRFGEGILLEATPSTSDAVRQVAEAEHPDDWAAIANATAARLYGLPVVEDDLSDAPNNLTRFMIVSRHADWPAHWPALPGPPPQKCSLCFALPEFPGTLMKYLRLFYQFQVNLTKLESRPTRRQYGDYQFFVDCDTDLGTRAGGALLQELKRQSTFFHWQGPYRELGLCEPGTR